jgi:NADH-quinone oxidoreductase subunit N
MVSYADLSMLFIGLEILSISMYIMASANKNETRSNEAGFKYFMLGAFATGFLLFGVAMIYGATGSFNLQEIAAYVSVNKTNLPVIFYAGILLMLVGLTFKIAAAPFHFWAPDVYEGAPTEVTAFMATVVKTAAFASFLRLFSTCLHDISEWWSPVIAIFASLSMLAGNLLAVYQKSLKRMMAYSSVAHAGYMLLAIVALNDVSEGALLFYAASYSIATIGIFALLIRMTKNGNESVTALHGLSKSNPFAAFAITVILLSLAGIPPVAGFFAKYYMFYGALKNEYTWLVLVAVASTLIGVYYYFRIIIAMFQQSDKETVKVEFGGNHYLVLAIVLILVIVMGILPSFVIKLI